MRVPICAGFEIVPLASKHAYRDFEMVHGHVLVEIQVGFQICQRLLRFSFKSHDFHGHHGLDVRKVKWFRVPKKTCLGNWLQIVVFPSMLLKATPSEQKLLFHLLGIIDTDLLRC